MLRSILLAVSKSDLLRRISMDMALAQRISRRFVAGEKLEEAVAVTKDLNAKGMFVSLDHLGENVGSEAEALRASEEILEILDAIKEHDLQANVSVKLTQLGLDVDENICERLVASIATKAKEVGTTVRLDMEGSPYTERTLQLFYRLHEKHENVGVVIQSYLYRSEHDVEQLVDAGANVRLCKGAYKEAADIAFQRKVDVDRNFKRLLDLLFSDKARRMGVRPCVATHDEAMISGALRLAEIKKFPAQRFEFQMLYGIRPDLQEMLVREDFTVRVYVPFGAEWYPYFIRRLAERPANMIFLLKNIFRS